MEILQVELERAGYTRGREILRDVSFSLRAGEMMGLIGPNGAGKSTAVKAILGFLKHVEGRVHLQADCRYGYIPEHPVFYDDLTVWEHLELAASVWGMPPATFEGRALELLERFQLREEKHHFPRAFSKGMQQKMMFVAGFLLQPDLYVLDEPFIGLDPRATKTLLQLLMEERRRGAAVLLSTHVLDTAEKFVIPFSCFIRGDVSPKGAWSGFEVKSGGKTRR